MLDHNLSNRINIDDFVRIISEFKISLSITDIQMLFHSYELYKNGLFFYEEMFKDLKKIYHNEKRFEILQNFYDYISETIKIQLRLIDLKALYDVKDKDSQEEFSKIVDSYEFIMV